MLADLSLPFCRNNELTRILERVVSIGLRGGWAELEDTPLALPRMQFVPQSSPASLESSSSPDTPADTSSPLSDSGSLAE